MIEINGMYYILKNDAPLYIDVTCYRCNREVALSNTTEIDGRKYCPRCGELEFQKRFSGIVVE